MIVKLSDNLPERKQETIIQ